MNDHPLLTSAHIIPWLKMVVLDTSIREIGDNFSDNTTD